MLVWCEYVCMVLLVRLIVFRFRVSWLVIV